MKKLILIFEVLVLFFLTSCVYSQIPGYMLVAKNFDHPKFTGNYVTFDIYLIHTDTTRFEYVGGEFYFDFYSPVANGGVLSYEILNDNGSQLPPNLRPQSPKVYFNTGDTSQLGLSLNMFPDPGRGFIIPQNSQGIKIIRMLLYTSVPSMLVRIDPPLDIHKIDLRLRWRNTPDLPATKLYANIDGAVTDISNPSIYSIDSAGLRIYPVEMISFNHSINKNKVLLNWVTASEINNSGFEIHRKLSSSEEWVYSGFVEGNGTVNSPNYYSFSEMINSGNYRYRLKQIDYNGNFEFFNLQSEVLIGLPSDFELHQNYPNPFNPTTNLEFEISELGFVSLKIYNALGVEVAVLVNEIKPAGYYSFQFDGANLPSGIYYYRLESGDFSQVKKMTLLK